MTAGARSDEGGVAMRRHARHRSGVPLVVELATVAAGDTEYLYDISAGGLRFRSVRDLPPGTRIRVTLPLVDPTFTADAEVVWCGPLGGGRYAVGVRFDGESGGAGRVADRVCDIEAYRRDAMIDEGRVLTSEEAAAEWLARHASGAL